MNTILKRLLILAGIALMACQVLADNKSGSQKNEEWWRHAVFYEIYPRSFADANNDGIGDLRGIASKMDYLQSLGIDAIWITPCFPSPQVDFGYDVSDYQSIDPIYGSLKDFDQLIAEANKHHIRVVLDFVVNHTSDQHPWFLDSKSSRTSAHRDWYIWRDAKPNHQAPNNWLSIFGSAAWKLDPTTNQYYYHYFYPEQPDLNWRNPEVEKAMLGVTRWWYKRGVSGFRLDAVDTLFEDPQLRDNPILTGTDNFGRAITQEKYNKNFPEVHDVMRKLRNVANEHNAVLIGETWTGDVSQLSQYYGAHEDELQMPMDLQFTTFKTLSAETYRAHISSLDASGHWPVYVLSNHDIVRAYSRYGDGKHNDQIAKMLATMFLTLRGSVVMYYGEEIGMENNNPKTREEVQDPIGKLGWPREIGRDGERTPMQWNTAANAGFSTTKPWLPVPASASTHNVAMETADSSSILSVYRKLLSLRHHEPALLDGEFMPLNTDDKNVFVYARRAKDETIIVALNISTTEQTIKIDYSPLKINSAVLQPLVETGVQVKDGTLKLNPYAAIVVKAVQAY